MFGHYLAGRAPQGTWKKLNTTVQCFGDFYAIGWLGCSGSR